MIHNEYYRVCNDSGCPCYYIWLLTSFIWNILKEGNTGNKCFTKRGGLIPSLFIYLVCLCFYNFYIGYLNCFDIVLFIYFLVVHCITKNLSDFRKMNEADTIKQQYKHKCTINGRTKALWTIITHIFILKCLYQGKEETDRSCLLCLLGVSI